MLVVLVTAFSKQFLISIMVLQTIIAIRQAGVSYLEQHPDLFIESVSDNSWKVIAKNGHTWHMV